MTAQKKVSPKPDKDNSPQGFGQDLVIVAPDGRVFSINEDDIQQYEIDEGTDKYKSIKKDFIDKSTILAMTPQGAIDACICVILNLKTLEANRSPKRK